MKPLFFVVLFLLAGCSAWTGSAPNESRFSIAAESWTGAPLDEMIADFREIYGDRIGDPSAAHTAEAAGDAAFSSSPADTPPD